MDFFFLSELMGVGIKPDSSEMRTKVSNRALENSSEREFFAVADNEQSADREAINSPPTRSNKRKRTQ